MVTVVVDEQGRLVEFVSMPAQLDPAPSAPVATDWQRMFDAAGLPMAAFKEIAPQWTPRVYADQRVAWEGPMPGHPETSVRVEAASYRGRPVAFQIVWPWTRPTRMEEPPLSTRARVLSLAGGVLVLALLLGAALLARHNLRSGRADHRGARRIAAVMFAAWFISWLLGARQPMALNAATSRFFMFAAFAILNTGFTWMFYLALEPFVRRYCPEILISWTRVLSGQLRDPRVGRDILIGVAAGVYVLLVAVGAPLLASWVSGKPSIPQTNSVLYLLGFRYTASHFVRLLPNALQTAMLTTFVYVLLLAVVRRRSIVIGALMLLLAIVAMAEAGDEPVWVALAFALLVGAPVLFVFVRYGLLATAIGLFINQAGRVAPFTTDIMRPHFADAAIVLLVLCGLAVYAFYISRAGEGMFRRLLPTA
jgi:serine/threonine-protein kinase